MTEQNKQYNFKKEFLQLQFWADVSFSCQNF
jgi:hypothetical protein